MYPLKVARELSTKRRNVVRRELRAIPVTYDGDPPTCPDCGCETNLCEGRFGRYYRCENYGCEGTVGATMDGTPRIARGLPEVLEARRRARDAIHAVLVEERRKPAPPGTWLFAEGGGIYVDVHAVLKRILERARLWEHRTLKGPFTVILKGVFLRKRSLEELARIEAAAREELRLLRWTPYWDRLGLDSLTG